MLHVYIFMPNLSLKLLAIFISVYQPIQINGINFCAAQVNISYGVKTEHLLNISKQAKREIIRKFFQNFLLTIFQFLPI